MLVPLADIMNHCAPEAANVLFLPRDSGLICVASQDIVAGSRLEWAYTDHTDDLFFLMYYGQFLGGRRKRTLRALFVVASKIDITLPM